MRTHTPLYKAGRDGQGMGNERVNEAMKWDLVDEIACGVPCHGDSRVDDVGKSNGGGTWRREAEEKWERTAF